MQKKTLKFLITIIFFTLCSCQKKQVPKAKLPKLVKAAQVGNYKNLSERAFPGKAEASQNVTLSFRVSGQILQKLVKTGDSVKKGQVLAKLDPTDFNNALKVAIGQLAQAEALFVNAQLDFNRSINVQKGDAGAISQQYVDKMKASMLSAQASHESAKASVKIVEDRLKYTLLKAPFDGEVSDIFVDNFETLLAKQPILRLLNRDYLEFKIDVPENLISYSKHVVGAHIAFDVKKNIHIPARIKEVGREASSSTRTYPVKLILKQSDKFEIFPGMAGKAYIKAKLPNDSFKTGIEIPSTALFSNNQKNKFFVWVINQNSLSMREVKVSLPSNYGVIIKEGLKTGEWIVTAGVSYLSEGQEVRLIDSLIKE